MIWVVLICTAVVLAVLMYATSVINKNLFLMQDERVEDVSHVFAYLRETVEGIADIASRLDEGVKLINPVQVAFHLYNVSLCFDDGETATKVMRTFSEIGYDDEIEILPEQDDAPEFYVIFDHDCFARHSLDDLTELMIAAGSSLSLFRDRLLSDGWKITSPETEEVPDAVLPDPVEAVCPGQ